MSWVLRLALGWLLLTSFLTVACWKRHMHDCVRGAFERRKGDAKSSIQNSALDDWLNDDESFRLVLRLTRVLAILSLPILPLSVTMWVWSIARLTGVHPERVFKKTHGYALGDWRQTAIDSRKARS